MPSSSREEPTVRKTLTVATRFSIVSDLGNKPLHKQSCVFAWCVMVALPNGNAILFPTPPKISQRMRWARKEELGGGHADLGIPRLQFYLGNADVC
jgi:hypothetical protein